ncbi:hypothetical protein AB0L41_49465 [Amycolatopsis mediterranei]|uniref:hypothetical protein n=1 Tax=Amycolatopsis mediterranei TaxID=33910 RepID=UPI00343B84B0
MASGRVAVDPPRAVADIAIRATAGPDAVAMAAALAQPWADVVLSGAASVAQLRSNLVPVPVDEVDRMLLADLAEDPAAYWHRRAHLAWT